jgi:hypothetical protein
LITRGTDQQRNMSQLATQLVRPFAKGNCIVGRLNKAHGLLDVSDLVSAEYMAHGMLSQYKANRELWKQD